MLKEETTTEQAASIEINTEEFIVTVDPTSPEVQSERVKAFEEQSMQDKEKGCTSRDFLHHDGYNAGYAAAADDYLNDNVKLELFAIMKDLTELGDHYAIGFECGYMRKLAEILVF